MKFNKSSKTIFLDPNSEKFEVDERVNIILSPSLYWVKKLSLPVKYARDAKKLLPSIFDDTLTEGNYNYSVYKKGEDFFAFAYDDKLILDTLAQKGVSSSNVENVYFAQSELEFEGALKVNETQSIYLKEDILILLPCCWIEESGELSLDDISHSKHSISLAQFGHIIDSKSIYKIGAILVVMMILVGVELFITNKKVNEVATLKETLFQKAKLQSTMFQNKATLKKYTKIHTKQTTIREYSSVLLSLKLQKEENINTLSLKDKLLVADFSKLSSQTIKVITKKLKSKKIKFEAKEKERSWHLEIKI